MCDARISIWLNNLTGGPKGATLCARAYASKLQGTLRGHVFVWASDKVFGENHCFYSFKKRLYGKDY